jgi:tRNA(Ile)-lysidine synthase
MGDIAYVGFSGGPDSCCLASTLKEQGKQVKLIHFDHQWPLDVGLTQKCRDLADQLDLPLAVLKGDKSNNEEEARHARYSKLAKECDELYVGHTSQDTLETAIYNLLRNPSLKGISSLTSPTKYLECYDLTLIRPLLNRTRNYTIQYCVNRNIDFHVDPYNKDLHIPRVYIRERVIPLLNNIHPGAIKNLLKFIYLNKDYEEYFESVIDDLWESIYNKSENAIKYSILKEQKNLIQKYVWMRFFRVNNISFSKKDIDYLASYSWEKPTRNLKGGVTLKRKQDYIY